MIRISSDRGLVRLDGYDQLLERPGFRVDLDPKSVGLEEVIGAYLFREPVRCGFSTCHQPHNRGFVITTKEGAETNIGKDCGRKHFGVDFNAMSRRHIREVLDQERREFLESIHPRTGALIAEFDEIWHGEKGVRWMAKWLPKLEPYVADMVRTRSTAIQTVRKATKEEIEDQESITGSSARQAFYITETIGHIDGLPVYFEENSFGDLAEFRSRLRTLAELDIPALSSNDLKRWAKWAGRIDADAGRYRQALAHGRRLLTKANVSQLAAVQPTRTRQNVFRKLIRKLP